MTLPRRNKTLPVTGLLAAGGRKSLVLDLNQNGEFPRIAIQSGETVGVAIACENQLAGLPVAITVADGGTTAKGQRFGQSFKLDGGWAAWAGTGFQDPLTAGATTCISTVDHKESLALDELLTDPSNPLGADADGHGKLNLKQPWIGWLHRRVSRSFLCRWSLVPAFPSRPSTFW